MADSITYELCEALCGLTHSEWNSVKISMDHFFGDDLDGAGPADPEFEAALERHMQLTANTTPEELYGLLTKRS